MSVKRIKRSQSQLVCHPAFNDAGRLRQAKCRSNADCKFFAYEHGAFSDPARKGDTDGRKCWFLTAKKNNVGTPIAGGKATVKFGPAVCPGTLALSLPPPSPLLLLPPARALGHASSSVRGAVDCCGLQIKSLQRHRSAWTRLVGTTPLTLPRRNPSFTAQHTPGCTLNRHGVGNLACGRGEEGLCSSTPRRSRLIPIGRTGRERDGYTKSAGH